MEIKVKLQRNYKRKIGKVGGEDVGKLNLDPVEIAEKFIENGSKGGAGLAEEVLKLVEKGQNNFQFAYDVTLGIKIRSRQLLPGSTGRKVSILYVQVPMTLKTLKE